MRTAVRRVGRGIREVLLFPFRLIWWILRGLGRSLGAVAEVLGDIVEGVLDGLGK